MKSRLAVSLWGRLGGASLVVAALLVASCGAQTVVTYEEDLEEWGPELSWNDEDSVSQTDSGGGGGVKDYSNMEIQGGVRYQIIPLHEPTLSITVEDHLSVRVKVVDYQTAQPAKHYDVKYKVIESNPECSQGADCGHFLVSEGTTDTNGNASVTFDAATTGNVQYIVEMSGPQAYPEALKINVLAMPTGTLKVKFNYSSDVPLHDLNVRLSKGFKSCTQFSPVAPWNTDIVGQKTVSSIQATPQFEELSLLPTYQVFATAMGPNGHLAAAGCIDAVHVLPTEQGVTEVTLNLYLLPLNPAGTFDTINNFDFKDAIPDGQVGDIINLVIDIFYDPGKVIIDMIKVLVSQYIGSWVTDLAFGLFEDALANLVTDWLLNNSPPFIQDLFVIGQDLVQIVTNLEVISKLKIAKLGSDYSVAGQQTWIGLNLYWKLGCDKDDPNYDDCGKHTFSMEDLNATDFPMDLIAGQYTAMISYDKMVIVTHPIEINYGKLILFVINNMLLPAISSFNSLTDLLYSIIDCAAIANGFVGSILSNIGVNQATLEGFCNTAETFILGPIEGLIGNLALDSRLRIHGQCRMVDENDDLIVDKLVEGQWWGHIEVNNQQGNEFQGTFEGERFIFQGQ